MKPILFMVLMAISFSNIAQQASVKSHKLQGSIFYDNQSPIEYVQILIQSFDNKILTYTFTDSLGGYLLTFETDRDSILLGAHRLGYLPQSIKLASSTNYFDVKLELSADSKLQEVVVSGDKPIETRGDTLSYFTQPFIDGSERSVEDVLAKLPGISVDKGTGIIKYQGKEIKKILLDGDDLTGNNYKVLSKNLSADWLEEVEILKRFTDSRLLQGIQQSEEVAINLILKEEAKAPLFGSIEAGAGNTSKYFGKVELLSYMKKLKLFALGEANNTGTDLETYDLKTYTSSQLEYKGFVLADQILDNKLIPPSFFGQEKFIFHQGQFFSNSMVVKPSPKLSIRLLSTIYNNQLNFYFTDSLFYTLPNQAGFSFTQQKKQRQQPFEVFQDLKIVYQLSTKEDITSRWQIKSKTNQLETYNRTNFQENATADTQTNLGFFGNFSYVNKFNTNWVSSTDIEFGVDQLDEELHLRPFDSTVDSIKQQVEQKYYNIGIFSRIDGVLSKGFYTNMLIGWSRTSSDFRANSLDVDNNINSFQPILNDYKRTNLFGEFRLEKHIRSVKLSAGSRIKRIGVTFNTNSTNKLFFEPTVTVSFKKTFYDLLNTKIKALVNTEYVFFKPNELYSSPLLADFRTAKIYSSNPNIPIKNNIMAFSVKVAEDSKSYLSGNIEWAYITSDQVLVNNLSFSDDLVRSLMIQGGKAERFLSNYSVDKYFSKVRSTIKLGYEYELSLSPLAIEDVSRQNRHEKTIFSVTSGTSLTKKINLSLGYKKLAYTNEWSDSKTNFNYSSYVAKVNIKATSKLRFTFDYQAVDFGNSTSNLSSVLNSGISFTNENERLTLKLNANNILNNGSVNIITIEPAVFSSTRYPLLPRFILTTIKYRF